MLIKTEINKNMCAWILLQNKKTNKKTKQINSENGPLCQQYKPGNVSALMQSIATVCTGGTAAISLLMLVQVLPNSGAEHTDAGSFCPGHRKLFDGVEVPGSV